MVGQVTKAFAAEGVVEAVDFRFYPWGNAYFKTAKCPGPDAQTGIHCWAPECGTPGGTPADDCFTGAPSCQHGTSECQGNAMEACAINNYPNASQYWPFVDCFEGQHDAKIDAAEGCAKTAKLDWSLINGCYSNKTMRHALEVVQAKATLVHNCDKPDQPTATCRPLFGTPNVYIDDVEYQGSDLLGAICKAFTGTKPAGCK